MESDKANACAVQQEKRHINATENADDGDLGNVASLVTLNLRSEEKACLMTNMSHGTGRKRNVHPLVLGMTRLRLKLKRKVLLIMIRGKEGIEVAIGGLTGRNMWSMRGARGIRADQPSMSLAGCVTSHGVLRCLLPSRLVG